MVPTSRLTRYNEVFRRAPRAFCPDERMTIVIDSRYCKGCNICVHFCPKGILGVSEEVNSLGYYVPYVIDGAKCSNCRQCQLLCPDLAIFVIEEQEGADG